MDINNSTLITVIVPIYNVEKYLRKCIESIRNQSYENIEIILVNDGSPDNSLEICREYALVDTRIRIIDKKNGGLSDARNCGLRVAQGEFIVLVDSDDYIHPQMIEILYDAIIKSNSDIAVCEFKMFEEMQCVKVNTIENANVLKNIVVYQANEVIGELFNSEKYVVFTVAWNKMYRKKVFDGIEYPIGKIHEDDFTTYKLLAKANQVVYVQQELYYYLQRNTSIMGEGFSTKRFHKVEAFKEQVDFLINRNKYVKESIKRYFWVYYDYIQKYKEYYSEEKEMQKKYFHGLMKECKKYKKYLSVCEYLQLIVKFRFPAIYKVIKRLFKIKNS